MLLAEGINLELKMTVTYDNMNDMEQIAEFSYKRGLPLTIVDYLYPQMACGTLENCRLNAEDMVDFLKRYFSVIGKPGNLLDRRTAKKTGACCQNGEDMERLDQDFDKIRGKAFTCRRSFFWVHREDSCGSMMTEPSNILETDFRTAWDKLTKGL